MKVTVIIPVKNGASTLGNCMQAIRNQTLADIEIIILDSMSNDGSREIALKYGAKIIDIPSGTFNHGLTRNIGVSHASGELVYLTVQDAWIANDNMFEKMAKHFQDSNVQGVVGHQAVPHDLDKNPVLWYKPYSKPTIVERQVNDIESFKKLPALEQQLMIAWDNVVAMYRKTALLEQPFIKTLFAEDWIWSHQALLKGWKMISDPSLLVYHYHHRTFSYAFKVAYSLNYHLYLYFKYQPSIPPIVTPILRSIYHLIKNKRLSFRLKVYWMCNDGMGRFGNFISVIIFLVRMKISGEAGLKKGYSRYCKTIPQGRQKEISE